MTEMIQMRTKKTMKLSDLFGDEGNAKFQEDETYDVYAEPTKLTPTFDPHYAFPLSASLEILNVLEKERRNNIWVSGPSGAGKTALIKALAAKVNADLRMLDGHEHMTPGSLYGRWRARAGETFFDYGIVVDWLRNGGWLCINEYDTLDASVVNALKPVLEHPRRLCLTEHANEMIDGHPDCRLIVTCNTQGRGDDTGMFVNTQVQSIADLRRFDAFVEVDYIPEAQEIAMLKRMFSHLDEKLIKKIVEVANKTRAAFKKGAQQRVLSTAEVINWCENVDRFASAHIAARVSFLNAYENDARMAVRDIINAVFGNEDAALLTNDIIAARASDKSAEG